MRRRALLGAVSALPFSAAAAQDNQAAFAAACARLAGTGAFPAALAGAARAVLEQRHGADKVAGLVPAVASWSGEGPLAADLEPLAQELLIILYTGETGCQRDGAPFYPWALAWQTLGFAPAPSLCGGGFAAWARS